MSGSGLTRQDLRMPHCEPDMTIGLFGGSFNPPHQGHVQVSELVLDRLQLDRVWWLVSPGNPLKDHGNLKPLAQRLDACRAITTHPRVAVTAFERALPTAYTAATVAHVLSRNPGTRFVWVMGADNLAGFHHWQDWRWIANALPIAVVDRPGSTLAFCSAKAALALKRFRVDETRAKNLALMQPPAWTFIHGPRSPLSSTRLRAVGFVA
jgi:nicotinate-nucleotide adenylyltransferase